MKICDNCSSVDGPEMLRKEITPLTDDNEKKMTQKMGFCSKFLHDVQIEDKKTFLDEYEDILVKFFKLIVKHQITRLFLFLRL